MIGSYERATWKNSRSGIIVPGRFAEGHELELPCSVRGWFRMEKLKDGEVIASRDFENLITNAGLNAMGSNGTFYSYCAVGTGTAAPQPTDASLGNLVSSTTGATNTAGGAISVVTDPFTTTHTWTWAIGAAVGNFTEVGCGRIVTDLSSRALIVDNLGNPVAFPVSADEQLRVTYSRGAYAPAAPILTTHTLSGTTYDLELRCIGGGSATPNDMIAPYILSTGSAAYMQVGTGTTWPTFGLSSMPGTVYNNTSMGNTAYVLNSFQGNFQGAWAAGTATAALRNVKMQLNAFRFGGIYGSALNKTATMNLILPFTTTWNRL